MINNPEASDNSPQDNPTNGEYSEMVPHYLRADQNILDQPPFTWIRDDENLIPDDLLVNNEDAFAAFIRGVLLFYPWKVNDIRTPQRMPTFAKAALASVTPAYQEPEKFISVSYEVYRRLISYAYLKQYVQQLWGNQRGNFTKTGNLVPNGELQPTYAAFAASQAPLNDKWYGLKDGQPGAATADTLASAVNGRSTSNRFYRVIRSGSLG